MHGETLKLKKNANQVLYLQLSQSTRELLPCTEYCY